MSVRRCARIVLPAVSALACTAALAGSCPVPLFADDVLYSAGDSPFGVAMGDLDGDGDLDLAIVNNAAFPATGFISVLLNNGNANFGDPASVHVRGREVPTSVCTGDIDGDGEIDAAVAGGTTDDIMVLRGRGDGTWLRDERVFPVEQGARALVCIDVNGDGRTDLAVGEGGKRLLIYPGNGSPEIFASDPVEVPVRLPGNGRDFVTAEDVDGNGADDVIIRYGRIDGAERRTTMEVLRLKTEPQLGATRHG